MTHGYVGKGSLTAPPAARSTHQDLGSTPGKRTLVEQLPVQRAIRAAGLGQTTDDVQAAAAYGTSGSGGALPHLETIQRLFGRHDVSQVKAHTDGAAREGATAMGAQAFASGARIAFAGTPDLHTAAHEAAHVVQQRGGVQLKGGVGEVGDEYERHADAVADRVVQGQSAEALLDERTSAEATPSGGTAHGAIQRKPVSALIAFFGAAQEALGVETENDYAMKCAAGFLAHTEKRAIADSLAPRDLLGGVDWKSLDVPDELHPLITQFPAHYLPTNAKVWKELFDRIAKRDALVVPAEQAVDLAAPSSPSSVAGDGGTLEATRARIIGNAERSVSKAETAELNQQEQQLFTAIKQAKITVNIPLDKLFNLRSPRLLNGFEVKEALNRDSPNIVGELRDQRTTVEHEMFGLPEDGVTGRFRPRYAALNFKGHPTGAAARNDYGLSYFVLSDALKAKCTVTIGDTFDRPKEGDWGKPAVPYGSVFPLSDNGIKALVKTIFALQKAGNGDMDSLIDKGDYKPNDNYLDVQIHDDVDVRTSGEQLWISRLEMALFNVPKETVIDLVSRITGSTYQLVD